MLNQIYTLTDNRGAAMVTELVGKHHVIVRWADGVTRKMSRGSLMFPAAEMTDSPAIHDHGRANERRHASERNFAAMKDRIRDAHSH